MQPVGIVFKHWEKKKKKKSKGKFVASEWLSLSTGSVFISDMGMELSQDKNKQAIGNIFQKRSQKSIIVHGANMFSSREET